MPRCRSRPSPGRGRRYARTPRRSDVQAAGHDALADIVPLPEAKVTADVQVVGDVVADDPQRDYDLRLAGLVRVAVIGVDQGAEDLGAVRLGVLGAQHHAVRPGTQRRAAGPVPERLDQGLELVPLHVRYHLLATNIVTRCLPKGLALPGPEGGNGRVAA